MSNDKIEEEFNANYRAYWRGWNEAYRALTEKREKEIARLKVELEKAMYSARQFCGAHIGKSYAECPVCRSIERDDRVNELEGCKPDPIQAARDAVIKAAGPCRDRMKEKATQSGVYAPFCEAVDALRALERPDPLLEAREAADALADAVRRVVKTWPMGDTAKWRLATAIEAYDKAIAARGGE